MSKVLLIAFLVFALTLKTHAQWKQATEPHPWSFPKDHGNHPEYQTEWWYFTGNLKNAANEPIGYQLTFFRQGARRDDPPLKSRWIFRDLYFAHFAVSYPSAKLFLKDQKTSRGALNTAGAAPDSLHVWIEDWRVDEIAPDKFRLQADSEEFAIDLLLTVLKPPILQGNRGLSQKSSRKGNASHYFSYTRLETHGTVRIDYHEHLVTGSSWFDKEFSTSALDPDQVGWDWFSIQLDNNHELMLYIIRQSDGSASRFSKGAWVDPDGVKTDLNRDQFSIIPRDQWTSPKTKATYPSGWTIRVPSLNLELEITPRLLDQELSFRLGAQSIIYWEGACSAQGVFRGREIQGHAFAEITGYAAPVPLR